MVDPCDGCVLTIFNVLEVLGREELDYMAYLQSHGVLKSSLNCPNCGQLCRLVINPPHFRCQRQRRIGGVAEKCSFSQSVKTNSRLSNIHLPFQKVVQCVTMWATTSHPRHDFLRRMLDVSSQTVVDWSNFCRQICIASIELLDVDIVGGPGMTVEVDKAKLGKRKNNRGREVEGSWIFGAFERGTNRCFFETVRDRSANCLLDVILRRIAPGTTVVSDLWRGYRRLANHPQYRHLTVNHSLNFVDPNTGAHSQNIERMWREVRSNIPRFGRNKNDNDGYLAEFYWKRKVDINDRVHAFFQEVARQY